MEMYGVGKIIVLMPFGSHLYGTNTPSSDYDYKGVFVPTIESAFTNRIVTRWKPPSRTKAEGEKNAPGDVDFELLSLHEFMRLLVEGQTMALDMIHAERGMLIETSGEWEMLYANRHRFYTRNLSAFVGYAKRQAAKYGIKGSRLACAKAWAHTFAQYPGVRIRDLIRAAIDNFGIGFSQENMFAHAKMSFNPEGDEIPLEVCGIKMTGNATTDLYLKSLEGYIAKYGERARQAETNEGVDWKAMSHAIRAAMMVRRILDGSKLSLPFRSHEASYLKKVKAGELPFSHVQGELEEWITEIEELSAQSTLPERSDSAWAMKFLSDTMYDQLSREVRASVTFTTPCLTGTINF